MNDAGTLAASKSADFIVLDANPLDDIANTRRISSVYLRGAAVDRTATDGEAGRSSISSSGWSYKMQPRSATPSCPLWCSFGGA